MIKKRKNISGYTNDPDFLKLLERNYKYVVKVSDESNEEYIISEVRVMTSLEKILNHIYLIDAYNINVSMFPENAYLLDSEESGLELIEIIKFNSNLTKYSNLNYTCVQYKDLP